MTVLRVKKHEEKFVILQKEILENPKITLKAKGLWAFCMAKPDNWEFHLSQLEATLVEGREALTSAIKELISFGYCTKIQNKDDAGRWTTVDYEIYETSELKKCLPQTGFPLADKPLADNPHLTRNKEKQGIKETTTTPTPSEKGFAAGSIQDQLRNSKLTPEQKEEAVKYYESNKEKIHNPKIGNPVGYVIHMVETGKHKEDEKKQEIIEKRKAWAEKSQYSKGTGYLEVLKDGVSWGSGARSGFEKFDASSEYWEKNGLAFN